MNFWKTHLPRLLLEAVLIFGSVYGAFLLEDRRSRNFERKVLIGKLETLEMIMKADSAKFEEYLGTSSTRFNSKYDQSVKDHYEALELLKSQDPKDLVKAYQMHKNNQTYYRLIKATIESNHNIQTILDGFEHMLIGDSTIHWLAHYDYQTGIMAYFVGRIDDHMEMINKFGKENYFVLSDNEKNSHILDYVSHPFYYNNLQDHVRWMEYLKNEEIPNFNKNLPLIQKTLRKEIEAQYSML